MAQRAFDAVKAAYETLSDPAKKETCMNVVNNARNDLDAEIARKRKEMRAAHKTVIVAEDEPSVYKQELHKRAVKVGLSSCFQTNRLLFSCLLIWND